MQHYGFRTRWLDIVDNIWSALWFACHEAHVAGKDNKFVSFEASKKEYCYVYMMQFGNAKIKKSPGVTITDKAMKVIDLRTAAPSLYLRPHSQHGLLAVRSDLSKDDDMDYIDRVVLVLKISTVKVLQWLGSSDLVQTKFMFPSPVFDQGYRILLENNIAPSAIWGCIQHLQ